MREKWGWKKLKDICLNKGEYGSGARKVEYDGKVRYIRITDIDDDGKLRNDEVVSPSIIEEKYFLEKDDLLFARSGSVGRTYLHQEDKGRYQYAGYLIRFKIDKTKAIPKYIYFFTKSSQYRSWVNKTRRSGTLSNINAKEYSNLLIPLPPLPIQKRIVSILEKAEKLKERRKKANEETNKIIQSVFYEMFGDVKRNPHNFKKAVIGDVAKLQGGFAFKSKDYTDEGIRLVKITNVHHDKLNWNEISYLPMNYAIEYKEFLLKEGDIVVAMTRPIIKSLNSVKVVQVHKDDLPALLNQRVGRFKILNNKLIKEYLLYFCYTDDFKKEIKKFSSISLQPNVSSSQIESIKILLPPLPLQLKFASIVKKIEAMKERQKKSTEDINQLFDALMQKAFKGELVS